MLRSSQNQNNQNRLIKFKDMFWVMPFITHDWLSEMALVPKLILKHCHILAQAVCFFLYFNLSCIIGFRMLARKWVIQTPKYFFYYVQQKLMFSGDVKCKLSLNYLMNKKDPKCIANTSVQNMNKVGHQA
jgi:hypothetical protein